MIDDRAKASDAPPFDVELESSDKEWPPDGEPFRVVLVFNSSTGYPHYDAFLEASLIYKTRETEKRLLSSHEMADDSRSENGGRGKDNFTALSFLSSRRQYQVPVDERAGASMRERAAGRFTDEPTPPPSGTVPNARRHTGPLTPAVSPFHFPDLRSARRP